MSDEKTSLTPFLVGGLALVAVGIWWIDNYVPEEYKRPAKGSKKRAPKTTKPAKEYDPDTRGNWRIEWLGSRGKLIHSEIDRGQTLQAAGFLAQGALMSQGNGGSIPSGRPKATRWRIVDLATGQVAKSGKA